MDHNVNIAEQLAKIDEEVATLRDEQKNIIDQIVKKNELKEKLLLELNSKNLKDPAWLFRNPTMPGVHEAVKKLFEEQYGGVYNGPHPSGYVHDDEYRPIQQNIEFWLHSYSKDPNRDQIKKNCDHFLENYLHIFDAVHEISSRWNKQFPEVSVVPFQFRSQDSGLDYLGYCPADSRWYHYTMVYGRVNTERVFDNWNDAFDFAYALANQKENYEDE